MFKIRLTAKARKQLKQITQIYQQEEVNEALLDIKEDPFIGKSLREDLTGRYTYQIGFFRIIYRINETDKIVTILKAEHRSIVYNLSVR